MKNEINTKIWYHSTSNAVFIHMKLLPYLMVIRLLTKVPCESSVATH